MSVNPQYEAFLDICRWQMSGNVDFQKLPDSDGHGGTTQEDSDKIEEHPLAESNCVTSLVKCPIPDVELAFEYHRPCLDLDMRCLLIETTTPGHHHLYIDKVLTWEQYKEVLEALGRVGILQKGFVDAAIRRQRSQLRTPWTTKEMPCSAEVF